MISYDQALALIAKEARPLGVDTITPAEALGRILAADIEARRSLPPFDNTAMDGFALCADDSLGAPLDLPVVGSVAAGDMPDMTRQIGAVEIMTGAPIPPWCDCVVPVENVDVVHDDDGVPARITIKAPVTRGAHIRRAGEDVQAGQGILRAGTAITPEMIAVLTALGLGQVAVAARPKIALIGTGAEVVRDPDSALEPGQIYDSNTPYLRAALQREGFESSVMPGSPDDVEGFLAALKVAGNAQLVLSTGAVSMGRRDFVPDAMRHIGARTVFHKTAIRPGKPILFARLPGGAYFFGLPGNPVSAAVGLAFFVLPLLNALTGKIPLPVQSGRSKRDFAKKKGLTMFAKARRDGDTIEVLHGQQSFRLAPLLEANGWAMVPAKTDVLRAGDAVEFVPFEGRSS